MNCSGILDMDLAIAEKSKPKAVELAGSLTLVAQAPTSPTKLLCGRRILLVEDEMLVLMDTEDMLAAMGCTAVVSAATVADGLARVAEGMLDAALLDLNLGGDRSYAVADALVAGEVPFAFATGYGAHGLREKDRGRPVLMKPYPADELARTMIGLLHRH